MLPEYKFDILPVTNTKSLFHRVSLILRSDLDVSTASLPAYGIDNPDQSPSQFTRSFARSSMSRRSQRSSTSGAANNNLNNTYNAMSPTSDPHQRKSNTNTATGLGGGGGATAELSE